MRVTAGPRPFAHMFVRPDGDRVVFLWTAGSPAMVQLDPGRAARVIEYALDGSSRAATRLDAIALTPGEPRIFRVQR